ncbi:fibroblast growth factor receptor 4 [Trichonephila inaurata madagascariensis]|uniref:receptor protein-tyrosine kinase n=1 Tax=Trichonephila inaurata madagascariensis TaxID=2747483 RepID=A0A8X7BQF4_9ARAC|nr:fibroblast growth factor receptor 4 [Trichonephila inaurata madagascariensis]
MQIVITLDHKMKGRNNFKVLSFLICFITVQVFATVGSDLSDDAKNTQINKTLTSPVFTHDFTETEVKAKIGSKIYLNCPAVGYPEPKIVWHKDGSPVFEMKDTYFQDWSLTKANIAESDEGLYTCIISNSEGSISYNFTVEVVKDIPRPPVFTKPGRMLPLIAKPAGSSAVLKCPASGYPIPEITWYKDQKPLEKDSHIQFQKWSIVFERLTLHENGIYTCVVSNSEGSIEFNFTLEVIGRLINRPIMMENYPSNQTAILGDTIIFECKYVSDLHPAVYWIRYFETNSTSESKNPVPVIKYVKSNDPNYTDPNFLILHNVTFEDAGWYGCVASNALGNSTQKAYLTVLPQSPEAVVRDQRDSKSRYGPLFTANISDSDVKVEIGSVLYLECPADGFPTPSISWLKDGSDVIKNKDVHFREWSLKIENVVERDEGVYTCVISNSEGVIDFKFSVHVVEGIPRPPVFTKLNKMLPLVAIPAGTTAVLKCPADGYPIPQITWLKNNVFLEKDDRIRFQRWSLKLEHVTVSDDGIYTCVVSNNKGMIDFNFTVEVAERLPHRPIMNEHYPSNQTAFIGETVVFECKFISDLHPAVHWIKYYDVNDTDYDIPPIKYVKSNDPNNTDPTFLILHNVTYEDSGWYGCIASNHLGNSTQNAYLNVLPYPEMIEEGKKKTPFLLIGFSVACGATMILITLFVLYHRRLKEEKRLRMIAASKPLNIFLKKRVILIHQNSGSSQNLAAPLVKIQAFDPNYENSAGISEYEVPLDPAWEFPREQLTFGKPLGRGAFGQVVQAEARGLNGQDKPLTVAVKMLKDGYTDQDLIDLISEAEMMKMVGKHSHIINLLGCCTQNGPFYVIVEYAANGNLRDYLRAHRPVPGYEISNTDRDLITEKNLLSFAYQIAKGMEYLSSKKCIHRDLAARNVLVMDDKVLKIADFGFARDVHENDYYRKTKNGLLPIKWMALESLMDRLYTTQSDVWSFGVLMWEIMTLGGMPYASIPPAKLFNLLKNGFRLEKPVGCRMETYLLMLECWNANPYERPTFATLVRKLETVVMDSSDVKYVSLDYTYSESSDSSIDDESETHQV